MKYLIFNLKSNLTFDQIEYYANNLKNDKDKFIMAPSNIYLKYFNDLNFTTCSQDVSKFDMGSYTGEVNAKQLKSIGTNYTIIAHHERRKYFKEDIMEFITKVTNSLNNGLRVIYCLTKKEEFAKELDILFNNIDDKDLDKIIIALEPEEAIGNNLPQIDYINSLLDILRQEIMKKTDINIPLIYGGGIHADNLADLKNINADGLLIGKSSNVIDNIFTLINELKQ